MQITRYSRAFILLISLWGCKPMEKRTVRMNNVMCRAKPDINSKVIQVFSKGTQLTGKPTNVQFAFMDITDVWYEIPDKKCFIFGGLLIYNSDSSKSEDASWRIEYVASTAGDIERTALRPGQYTHGECERILAAEEAEFERKKAEYDKRNGSLGVYGGVERSVPRCVQR